MLLSSLLNNHICNENVNTELHTSFSKRQQIKMCWTAKFKNKKSRLNHSVFWVFLYIYKVFIKMKLLLAVHHPRALSKSECYIFLLCKAESSWQSWFRNPVFGRMFLLLQTSSTASSRVRPSLIMRKANTRVPERLIPRAQWTSTLPAQRKKNTTPANLHHRI